MPAVMRVVAKSRLKKLREHPGGADARGPLCSGYERALEAKRRSSRDIKDRCASASICGNNLVAFNAGANRHRLVAQVQYQAEIVWVKVVDTHMQYDRIGVESVVDHETDPKR